MGDLSWKLEDAKARFSEVVRLARSQGPQRVTVRGKDAVVVMSVEDLERLSPQIRELPLEAAIPTIPIDAIRDFLRGPRLVTADELPPGCVGLRIQSRLNGQVMQDANTRDMAFGVARTIALLSESLTLEPGDVVVMGTPGGVGYARTPPVWMKPGDRIEVEIEGIGVLSNPVTR